MNKYEKDLIKLLKLHEYISKVDLINNINTAIWRNGIKRRGKNEWVSKVTGSPIGTVDTWFSKSNCKSMNKMPLYATCQIAVELHVSVWSFYETNGRRQEKMEKPDRRGTLYRQLGRNEAEKRWNESHRLEDGLWEEQSKAVRRNFLDQLYWESIEKENGEEIQNE